VRRAAAGAQPKSQTSAGRARWGDFRYATAAGSCPADRFGNERDWPSFSPLRCRAPDLAVLRPACKLPANADAASHSYSERVVMMVVVMMVVVVVMMVIVDKAITGRLIGARMSFLPAHVVRTK
jgi:hypothetical protein